MKPVPPPAPDTSPVDDPTKDDLTRSIISAATRVHSFLGPGFLESVYQKALYLELRQRGLPVELERRIQVRYLGSVVGEFITDVLVADRVVVEVKAVGTIAVAHEVQVVNILTAIGFDTGLLLNFGAARLQFRRKSRILRPGQRESSAARTGPDGIAVA